MKIIDIVSGCKKLQIISNYCPSDFGYKNKYQKECTFNKTGEIIEDECLKCWFQDVDDEKEKR